MSNPEPFRKAAAAYAGSILGGSILPLPAGKKAPPLRGRTGQDGKTTKKTVRRDAAAHPTGNVGLRPPEWLLGIDVDGAENEAGKVGPATLAAFEAAHGAMPKTLTSSRHGKSSPTRIHWFRIPAGEHLSQARFGGADVDLIQHAHRYAVVWPSRIGATRYRWYAPDGSRVKIPAAEHIADLPDAWLEALRHEGLQASTRATDDDVDAWLDAEHSEEIDPHTAALIEHLPRNGEGDATLRTHLLKIAGSAHRSGRGRRAALEAFEAAWFDGHPDPYGNRRKFWTHDVPGVIAKIADEPTAPPPLKPFEMAPPKKSRKPKAERSRAPKKRRAKKAKKKTDDLAHEEYEPRGAIGEVPRPDKPLEVAATLLAERILPPLAYHRQVWHAYTVGHWQPVTDDHVFDLVAHALRESVWMKLGQGGLSPVDWAPTPGKITAVVRMIQSEVTLDESAPPSWLDGRDAAVNLIPARDCLLDPRTGKTHPRSAAYFSLTHLDAEVRTRPPEPKAWHAFLESIWPGDEKSKALLQEWLGYVISGETARQKGLLMIGPPRSGKGTIMAVASDLVGGEGRGTLPVTMTNFSQNFGLQGIEYASLVILGDMRGSGREAAQAAQSLLEIIGGDPLRIDRKHISAIQVRPAARVMVGSNEVPRLYDDADAINTRFLMLRMRRSFIGREDLELREKLRAELGGIALWALEGFHRLNRQGTFTVPDSDAADRAAFRAASAPLTAFVDETCVINDEHPGTAIEDLWAAYQAWCGEGHDTAMERSTFNRQMDALGYGKHRPRGIDGDDTVRGRWRYRGLVLRDAESAQARARRMWGPGAGGTPIDEQGRTDA